MVASLIDRLTPSGAGASTPVLMVLERREGLHDLDREHRSVILKRRLASVTRRFYVGPGALTRAAVAQATALACVIAFAGLLLENATSQVRLRAVFLVLSLVLLTLCTRWLTRVKHDAGTLYYLSAQAVGTTDDKELLVMANGVYDQHLDVRSLRAKIRVTGHETCLDMVSQIDEFSRDLERTMNHDSLETRFHFAVNLLFPFAFGLGQRVSFPDNATLIEVNHKDSLPGLTWGPGRVALADTVATSSTDDRLRADVADLPVLVSLGPNASHILFRGAHLVVDPGQLTAVNGPTRGNNVAVDELVRTYAIELLRTLQNHPDQIIFVRARLLKTVSLALGWLLADPQRLGDVDPDLRLFFRPQHVERLVPLLFDTRTQTHVPVRVHRMQPAAGELSALWAESQETGQA